MTLGPRRVGAAAPLLLIVPAVVLLGFIASYGVNGPTWDHLSSADIFQAWDRHEITLEFLFRQHNEHRKVLPRLVVLGLGLLTRFNNRAEMYLQWVLLCASVGIVFRAFKRDTALASPAALLAFLPVGWMLLSLRPYDVLLVGDGLLTYLSMVFIAGALYLLVFGRRGWSSFAGAVGCGLATSFSQSNGLLVWPIGAAILASELRAPDRRVRAPVRLVAWVAIGAATMAAYFHGYHDPGNHPPASFVFQHPFAGLRYFLAVTGGSLSPEPNSAAAAGLIVTALEALCGFVVLRAWWRERVRPPFGAWLVLLAVATQFMITLNRAGFGVDQAMSPRYAAYSCFGPIGVYWCGVAWRDRFGAARTLATSVATLLVFGYLAGSLDTWEFRNDWYAEKHWKAYLLYAAKYQPASVLETVYSNPVHTLAYAGTLERLRLNVFAEPHVRVEDLTPSTDAPPFAVESIDRDPVDEHERMEVEPQDEITVRGWALDPGGRTAAPAVFGTIDGRIDIPGGVGMAREPFAETPRRLRWTGFGVSFGGFVVPPGEHTFALKIVLPDRAHYYLTPPVMRIVRK
jgi:hypothetical protein